ncbi:ABC transporter ATP-binding protein [Clostridium sporogenes]|uniref:ABC transporter ATP-binding protein n=1 Tax=unclassified Clostridium TaxID=2614128 RepID=UPI0013D0B4E3|nr:ABC transporter ATP-binding protein [Clostridium sporogenes]NFS26329.1 ABC transporter ATP-binding protein [Clostridium sporogenes]
MIKVLKKIWNFSGNERHNIRKSIIVGFINAIFNALSIAAIYVVLQGIVQKSIDKKYSILALLLMVISVVGKIITQYYSQLQRTHAGYFMVADKRIELGDKLKNVPMGYFNKNSLGNITAIATTILGDVEGAAPVVLILTLGGALNTVVFAIAFLIYDWRVGLTIVVGMCCYFLVTALMEKKSRIGGPKRQEAQGKLVEVVLEAIQGMAVIKAFNLSEGSNRKLDRAIEDSCNNNSALEKDMTPFITLQQIVLNIFSGIMVIEGLLFYFNGTMKLVDCIMVLVSSFLVFEQLKMASSGVANLRMTENSIDRANEITKVPVIDVDGENIKPANMDIQLKNVGFAYDKKEVLKNINLEIPENTMTAIIGPSGSGKTTLCNLIARFWDVTGGSISLGGKDIRKYKLDSLMKNISMVFQNVYLFEDTVENNIKFGTPNVTRKDVINAAKRACCHEFIEKLEKGYDTIIGEGGATLSGGEKQRLSIARALLKDSPIVIFDEATANIDPENEEMIQKAIEALTKEKTIIMIAHRLKTVKNADQIIVLDNGEISQKGIHKDLINQQGIYADFVKGRKEAIGWKLA